MITILRKDNGSPSTDLKDSTASSFVFLGSSKKSTIDNPPPRADWTVSSAPKDKVSPNRSILPNLESTSAISVDEKRPSEYLSAQPRDGEARGRTVPDLVGMIGVDIGGAGRRVGSDETGFAGNQTQTKGNVPTVESLMEQLSLARQELNQAARKVDWEQNQLQAVAVDRHRGLTISQVYSNIAPPSVKTLNQICAEDTWASKTRSEPQENKCYWAELM
jgi:hypothetical protein